MDLETFRFTFPEFRDVVDEVISAQLARAARFHDPIVWGQDLDDGIALWTAANLSLSPMGMGTRLKPGGRSTNTYWDQYEELRQCVVVAVGVSGGFCGVPGVPLR